MDLLFVPHLHLRTPVVCVKMVPFAPGCSIDIAMGFDISRRSGAIGETLVSGHARLRDLLPDIVRDISTVKGLCCFGDEVFKPNISYRVVSRNGDTMYDFNFEAHSQEVVTKVMTTTVREPTYFNTAMLKSFEEKFRAQSGAGVKVSILHLHDLNTNQLLCKLHLYVKQECHLNVNNSAFLQSTFSGDPLRTTRICNRQRFRRRAT